MRYQNPVIRGFNPDPSICRVENNYYLVTSSFEYFPGIPLYHSLDLVNWRQIGNCVDAHSFPLLEGISDSGGIWAPTIRHHAGVFYVTATLEGHGNFIVMSQNPTKGFSAPVWVAMGGIDPSLYFENDCAYYCTNFSAMQGREAISLAEIDIATGALQNAPVMIFGGTGGGYLEAPHIYRIDDYYYLLMAEGGTDFTHMATIARSRALYGPYEACPFNPILSNRSDTSRQVQCAGHADLFTDHLGEWWMVHLGTRLSRRTMTNLGRETFLMPVTWQDGWPRVGEDGKSRIEMDAPLWAAQQPHPCFHTRFEGEVWESEFIFLRKRDPSAYARGDGLMLYPRPETFESKRSPTFVALRQMDFDCTLETGMTFAPQEGGDEAGIAIYLASDSHYRFCKRSTEDGDRLIVHKTAEDMVHIVYDAPLRPGKINLRVTADKAYYHFYCAFENEGYTHLCKASTRFLSCEVAGRCFTGVVMGLYAMGTGGTAALFDELTLSKTL